MDDDTPLLIHLPAAVPGVATSTVNGCYWAPWHHGTSKSGMTQFHPTAPLQPAEAVDRTARRQRTYTRQPSDRRIRPKPEIRPLAGFRAKTVIRPRASLDHLVGAGE